MGRGPVLARAVLRAGVLAALLPGGSIAAPQDTKDPDAKDRADAVVLEVGDQKFTKREFLLHLKQVNPLMDFAQLPASEKQHWLDEYARTKLLAGHARADGLDQRPEVRARIAFFVDRVLAQAYQEQITSAIEVQQEELEAYYREHPDAFHAPARVQVEHFLYRTTERAQRAKRRLEANAPHAELAEEKRSDAEVLLIDRGWYTSDLLVPEVARAAFALPPGGVSEVIQTGYGYHVLRVQAREEARRRAFAEVRGEIQERMRQEKASRLLRQLIEQARAGHRVRLHPDAVR